MHGMGSGAFPSWDTWVPRVARVSERTTADTSAAPFNTAAMNTAPFTTAAVAQPAAAAGGGGTAAAAAGGSGTAGGRGGEGIDDGSDSLCHAFTRGMCIRGTACHFSHSLDRGRENISHAQEIDSSCTPEIDSSCTSTSRRALLAQAALRRLGDLGGEGGEGGVNAPQSDV